MGITAGKMADSEKRHQQEADVEGESAAAAAVHAQNNKRIWGSTAVRSEIQCEGTENSLDKGALIKVFIVVIRKIAFESRF